MIHDVKMQMNLGFDELLFNESWYATDVDAFKCISKTLCIVNKYRMSLPNLENEFHIQTTG